MQVADREQRTVVHLFIQPALYLPAALSEDHGRVLLTLGEPLRAPRGEAAPARQIDEARWTPWDVFEAFVLSQTRDAGHELLRVGVQRLTKEACCVAELDQL